MSSRSQMPPKAIKPIDIEASDGGGLVPLMSVYPKGDGRLLKMIKRTSKAAIFSLGRDGKIHGYEVFKIRIKPARTVFGKSYPAQEVYPSDEQFGGSAKSCKALDDAERYFKAFNCA